MTPQDGFVAGLIGTNEATDVAISATARKEIFMFRTRTNNGCGDRWKLSMSTQSGFLEGLGIRMSRENSQFGSSDILKVRTYVHAGKLTLDVAHARG